MSNKITFTSKQITGIAILVALIVVLQSLGGTIVIGPVQLNFTLVPIVLGSIIFGPLIGAFLGFLCGFIVLIQVIIGSVTFYALIWANDPVVTTLTCIVKTTLAGYLSGIAYKIVSKKNQTLATFVAAAIVPIVNTGIFIIGCLLMTNSVYAMAGTQNVLIFILVSLVTFNFFVEFAINIIVSPALNSVLKIIKK